MVQRVIICLNSLSLLLSSSEFAYNPRSTSFWPPLFSRGTPVGLFFYSGSSMLFLHTGQVLEIAGYCISWLFPVSIKCVKIIKFLNFGIIFLTLSRIRGKCDRRGVSFRLRASRGKFRTLLRGFCPPARF